MSQFKNVRKIAKGRGTGTLGAPPGPDVISHNLEQPENIEAAASKVIAEIRDENKIKKSESKRVGRPVTSDKTAPFSTKLKPAFKKKLKMASAEFEIDMGDLIEVAVSDWISKKRKAK